MRTGDKVWYICGGISMDSMIDTGRIVEITDKGVYLVPLNGGEKRFSSMFFASHKTACLELANKLEGKAKKYHALAQVFRNI